MKKFLLQDKTSPKYALYFKRLSRGQIYNCFDKRDARTFESAEEAEHFLEWNHDMRERYRVVERYFCPEHIVCNCQPKNTSAQC